MTKQTSNLIKKLTTYSEKIDAVVDKVKILLDDIDDEEVASHINELIDKIENCLFGDDGVTFENIISNLNELEEEEEFND